MVDELIMGIVAAGGLAEAVTLPKVVRSYCWDWCRRLLFFWKGTVPVPEEPQTVNRTARMRRYRKRA